MSDRRLWSLAAVLFLAPGCDDSQKRMEAQRKRDEIEVAADKWTPADAGPQHLLREGRKVLAIYQFRIESFVLPADYESGRTEELLKGLKPRKVLTFKRSIRVVTDRNNIPRKPYLFVVVHPFRSIYTPYDAREEEVMRARSIPEWREWINEKGEWDHFFAVLSMDADIVHRFNVPIHRPETVAQPLDHHADGPPFALLVGSEENGEYGPYLARPREVWIWNGPNSSRIVKAEASQEILRERFKAGKL